MIRIASSQSVDNCLAAATAKKKSQADTLENRFSEIIAEKIANPPFANTDEAADQPAVTISKIMPDGSVLITTVQGTKVISQRRTRGNDVGAKDTGLSTLGDNNSLTGKMHKTKIIPTLTETLPG